jgi:hypothetical protein
LAACCVKLLDKNVMPIYKNNTLKNALEKLSSCETLRKKFIDMLEKCGPVKPEITLADNFFLMYRIVEKQMHSRQKNRN